MPGPKYGPENTEDNMGLLQQDDQVSLGKGKKTASATAGAATLHQPSGVITSEALTTAADSAATYTLTITNSQVIATDIVQVTLGSGTNTAGTPVLVSAVAAAGSIVCKVMNVHPSAALNGTLTFAFVVWKA